MKTETLNHVFSLNEDGTYTSRPATEQEIEDARKDLIAGGHKFSFPGRSCWECNPCHSHHIEWEAYQCFACGKRFHKGVDILNYEGSNLSDHTHIDESKINQ